MIIRRETLEDHAAVDLVISAAFQGDTNDRPVEADLVHALRRDAGWIEALSLVAERDGRIVGHVVCTRGWVGELAALGLGPLSVLPDDQGQGVGQALMHAIIAAAEAAGEALIALLGDHQYYGRFGFVEAALLGILSPDPAWGEHFQVRALSDRPSRIDGTFRYAAPFNEL